MSPRLRLLRMGLSTLFGLRVQGYFIPYRYAGALPQPPESDAYPAVERLFAAHRDRFAGVLGEIDQVADDLRRIGSEPPPAPRWNQDWFPRLDVAAAYAMVRHRKPARIVEVGSGHSTRFLARAAADGGLRSAITAIDPVPRADIADLDVAVVHQVVQRVDTAPFQDLEPGDMLFIDSSHILMPGSDVDWLLGTVLPGLPVGVHVHIHDIFLPDGYPAAWAWRGYNEQSGVAALLAGGGWTVRFASHYVATRMAPDVAATVVATLPPPVGVYESSLWLEKTAGPQ